MEDTEVNRLIELLIDLEHDRCSDGCRNCAVNRTLAEEFGRRREWTLSGGPYIRLPRFRYFSIADLVGCNDCIERHRLNLNSGGALDHTYDYRAPKLTETGRPWLRPVAYVAYLYSHFLIDAIQRFADERGLTAELPTDFPSWWYPGRTRLVVYEGKARGGD